MPKARFNKARISGIAVSVPPIRKSLAEEVDQYGGNLQQIERIRRTIGLKDRYVVDAETTAGDLCESAAEYLIQRMSLSRDSLDAVICVTQTPDYFQPATAAVLHGRLGLKEDCAAFDVNLGCSGYIYGLWLAYMMIESGSCRKVLLLAGDTISRCVNPRDRTVAPLFGDAGSATLVEEAGRKIPAYFSLKTDGRGFQHIIVPAGAFRRPSDSLTREEMADADGNIRSPEDLYMNGAEVFNFSIKVEPPAIREILEFAGKTMEEVDYLVFHQANKYIISNIARRLKVPLEKAPCGTVEKYGNQSSASIPSTLCDALGETLKRSSRQVVLSGFGVGLSWASGLTLLENLECCEVFFYVPRHKNQ